MCKTSPKYNVLGYSLALNKIEEFPQPRCIREKERWVIDGLFEG